MDLRRRSSMSSFRIAIPYNNAKEKRRVIVSLCVFESRPISNFFEFARPSVTRHHGLGSCDTTRDPTKIHRRKSQHHKHRRQQISSNLQHWSLQEHSNHYNLPRHTNLDRTASVRNTLNTEDSDKTLLHNNNRIHKQTPESIKLHHHFDLGSF